MKLTSTALVLATTSLAAAAPHAKRQFNFIDSGILGGEPQQISASGDPALPFFVSNQNFATPEEAAAFGCQVQFDGCVELADQGLLFDAAIPAGVEDCQAQFDSCGLGVSEPIIVEKRQFVSIESGDVGADAPEITDSGDPNFPFFVQGETFATPEEAVARGCEIQRDNCATVVDIAECEVQFGTCRQA